MTDGKASSMIEVLTPIWERVLRRSAIPIEENFFDQGGDSSLAQELFQEIGAVLGRKFAPVTICYAPTISALSELLGQPATKPLPPLVLLKTGGTAPPVFITHGIGGSTLDLVKLAKGLKTQQPIYGMQFRGMDGIEEPFDRIEDMAQWFLDAIHKAQPHGPYFLIGYSLGGLITLEMAQRLAAQGEEIALLAMLDTYPHVRRLSARQRARLRLRLGWTWASSARRRILQQFLPKTRHSENSDPGQLARSSVERSMDAVIESSYVVWKNYNPSFYKGKINFVRAEASTYFPDDPISVWAHLAHMFEIETIPGTHLEMLTTHCAALAAVLSRYLSEAFSGSR
jgi:thioesterase domain-containing protein